MYLCRHVTRLLSPIALVGVVTIGLPPDASGMGAAQVRRNDAAYGAYVVSRLAEASGFAGGVRLGRAPVAYAQAAVIDDEATILYNPESLRNLELQTGTPWSAVSVIAHELGHHYFGHTHLGMRGTNPDAIPQNELDADYFSGYVLARVGARLADAQAAQRSIGHDETLFHPDSTRRLHAIRAGWLDGAAGVGISPEPWLRMESATPGRVIALRASLSSSIWERLRLHSGQW